MNLYYVAEHLNHHLPLTCLYQTLFVGCVLAVRMMAFLQNSDVQ
jgi:hypothetical protein